MDKIVIPAAGNGTRLWPIARNKPKELLNIGKKLMIDYAIEEALSANAEVGIIISERKKSIRVHVESKYGKDKFKFFYQKRPKGLGDAILYAKDWVSGSFGVILPDDIIVEEKVANIHKLVRVHRRFNASVIGVTPSNEPERYGVVIGEDMGEGIYFVKDIIEKPHGDSISSNMVIIGRYILTPAIFKGLGNVNPRTGEVELTDGIKNLLKEEDVYAVLISGKRLDCGYLQGYEKCSEYFTRRGGYQ